MEPVPVTHEQIYARLCTVEAKVDAIDTNTKDLVDAVKAAKGALTVLNWIASLAKPIGIIIAIGSAIAYYWHNLTGK
jgi:hypothetical protein